MKSSLFNLRNAVGSIQHCSMKDTSITQVKFCQPFRFAILFPIILLILSPAIIQFPCSKSYAQGDNSRWRNVKEWKGTINITGNGNGTFGEGGEGIEYTIQCSANSSFNIQCNPCNDFYGNHFWDSMSSLSGLGDMHETWVLHNAADCDGDGKNTDNTTFVWVGSGLEEELSYCSLLIDEEEGMYYFDFVGVINCDYSNNECGKSIIQISLPVSVPFDTKQPLPKTGLMLSGSGKYTTCINGTFDYTDLEATWSLSPVTDETVFQVTKHTPDNDEKNIKWDEPDITIEFSNAVKDSTANNNTIILDYRNKSGNWVKVDTTVEMISDHIVQVIPKSDFNRLSENAAFRVSLFSHKK